MAAAPANHRQGSIVQRALGLVVEQGRRIRIGSGSGRSRAGMSRTVASRPWGECRALRRDPPAGQCLYQERIELIERLHVGGHRGGGKILCSKMAREGADRIGQIEGPGTVGIGFHWSLTPADSGLRVVG